MTNRSFQFVSILLGTIVLFIFGCSTVRIISTEGAPGFSLSNYQSFDFFRVDAGTDPMPEFNQRIEWIKEELKNQLESRGVMQSSTDPDLEVNIGIAVVDKMQTRDTDIRSDAMRYMGGQNYRWESQEVEVGAYQEGTVVIHFVDAEDDILVWEGIAQSVVVEKEKNSKKNIAAGMKQLFKNVE